MFQQLLISTDLDDGLQRLVNHLPDLAATGIKKIVFLHAVPLREEGGIPRPDAEKLDQSQQALRITAEQIPNGLEVKVEIASGRPVPLILDAIKKHQPDLLLMGMPTRSLLNEKLFGSTGVAVVQQLSIPLLILRPQLVGTLTEEELALRCQHLFRYLLVPYDHSDSARYLVDCIKRQAESNPMRALSNCRLCWVVDHENWTTAQRAAQFHQAEITLNALARELMDLGLQVHTQVSQGNPITEMLAVARDFDISAIAVCSGNVGKVWELSIPSFTGEMMRRSWHPVLFFPPRPR